MAASSDRLPRLHVLVSEREAADSRAVAVVCRLLEEVAPIGLHLRARLPTRRLYELAADWSARARPAGSWLIVNGRPDVALAARARAVQLGRSALTVADGCRVRGEATLAIGASVHGVEAALAAVSDGADYLVLGTAYPTPSHPGRPGLGAEGLRRVVGEISGRSADAAPPAPPVPVLAIGGIDRHRCREVREAGLHGIVVGRAVWEAEEGPLRAAEGLAAALERSGHVDDRGGAGPRDRRGP